MWRKTGISHFDEKSEHFEVHAQRLPVTWDREANKTHQSPRQEEQFGSTEK